MATYLRPQNYCKLSTVKKICKRVDQTGLATEHKAGSGWLKFIRSDTNIAGVDELICSHEGQSDQDLITREIAAKLDISDRSVHRIVKKDLYCLNNATLHVRLNVLECAKIARWHFPARPIILRECSTIKWCWYLHVSTNMTNK